MSVHLIRAMPFARLGRVDWSRPADAPMAGNASSSSCGNAAGTCRNHWACIQRQGFYGHECFDDLRDQRR